MNSAARWTASFTNGTRSSKALMSPILFYFFAIMTLVFGVAVVANRNPIASALSQIGRAHV